MAQEPTWNRISEIFEGALDQPVADRSAWIAEACGSNEALRSEVEKLLAAHGRAEGVLDKPVEPSLIEGLRAQSLGPALGDQVGPYRIVEEIGRGGMGVVYKAEDPRLDRFVALKFLSPGAMTHKQQRLRFIREAKAAAALDHPNICTVYEISDSDDATFIAMAYLGGESLDQKVARGPLPVEEALDIAQQVAQGLQAAHRKGIVHRDIKPANVILTPDGQARIVDFGIALLGDENRLTNSGVMVGTTNYMSPEQATGAKVDHRTDIWSWGAVLYEMISGRAPFRGPYGAAVVYSIVNENPAPLTGLRTGVSIELENIAMKAMEKNREERYQHTDDLLVDVRRARSTFETGTGARPTTAGRPAKRPSIAVLPFVSRNPDEESEFLGDGITEDITAALTKVEGLRVAAYNSAFQFKGRTPDIREVGQRLRVEHVLVGTIRRVGERLRITVRLSNVMEGSEIWSERYDRVMDDIFEIQDEISEAVVAKLKGRLLGEDRPRIADRYTSNARAYSVYLKGRHHWQRRGLETLRKAKECFEQALAEDPNYALAHSGLADCYVALGLSNENWPPTEVMGKARSGALRAIEIDEQLPEAHASLAFVELIYGWNWRVAERELQRTLELDPNYANAYFWRAVFLLPALGHLEEAVEAARKGQELDPVTPTVNVGSAIAALHLRQYERAIEESQRSLDLDADYVYGHLTRGRAFLQLGEYEKGFQALERARLLTFREGHVGYGYAISGQREKALEVLDSLNDNSRPGHITAYQAALVYTGLGERKPALEKLKMAVAQRAPQLVWLSAAPELDPLRGEPEFRALQAKMNLSTEDNASA